MDIWASGDDSFFDILNDLLDLFMPEAKDEGFEERSYHHNDQVYHLVEVCGVALAWP